MEKWPTAGAHKTEAENLHQIVQQALRGAVTAATPDSAIDLLGEALLELERPVAQSGALIH